MIRKSPRRPAAYRARLALLAMLGGLAGLAGLYFVPIPPGNREPLLLALGLVPGWGSTVIGHEFGSTSGRRPGDLRRPG